MLDKRTGTLQVESDPSNAGTEHLGHLRSIIVWARDARLIDYAPKIERPSKPDPKDHHITKSEAERLIAGAKAPHIELAIRLMLGTGARVAAALDLTWDRVDFVRGTIKLANLFEQTARKGRATVPMNRTLREALEKAKWAAITPFVIEYAGDRISSIRTGMHAAATAAHMPEVTPHVLRHSAAVWMAEAGHGMEEIAQFLGHSDSNITRKVYARYSPTHLRGLADSLDF